MIRRPHMRVVRNANPNGTNGTPTNGATCPPPPEPPFPWKAVALTTVVSVVVAYAVGKAINGVEQKVNPAQPNTNPQQMQPLPVYIVDAMAGGMPRAMGGEAEAQSAPIANPTTRNGLTESDLSIWANELQQREAQLEQRQQFLDQETRRLRLVR